MSEKEFELYLELLSRFLKLRPGQRAEIADELRDHLEIRLEELSRAGLPRDEAIKQALGEFGDASNLAEHFTRAANWRKRRFLIRATLGTVAGVAAMILIATALWPEPAGNVPQVAVAQQNGDKGKGLPTFGGKTFEEWKVLAATDLNPKTRAEACEAFAAFGANGYPASIFSEDQGSGTFSAGGPPGTLIPAEIEPGPSYDGLP